MSINLLPIYLHTFGWQLAQVIVQTEPDPDTVEDAALVFSGPQFFTALIAGVVLAFAFQLLFTNLGVAAGISLLGGSSSQKPEESESFGHTIRKIGTTVGLGTLISVTIALFLACILAVKLSLFVSPVSGAIVGLVIWATFFSLMMWLSSSAVGSLLGSIANTATSGIQAIFGTATAAIGAKAASNEVVNTAEAVMATVRRELGMGIDSRTMRENVEDFLALIKTPELDVETIAADFERLLDNQSLKEVVETGSLPNIDRDTFVQLISDRSDLSKRDIKRIATKFESIWQKATNQSSSHGNPLEEFANFLTSASKEQLIGEDLGTKLDGLVEKMSQGSQPQSISPLSQVGTMTLNGLMGLVLGRTDLSDLDIDKITHKLETLKEYLEEQTDKLATQVGIKEAQSQSTVRRDLENYLLNAYPWQLKQNNLDSEFRNLLYDPDADSEVVAAELHQINRSDLAELLQQKGIYTQTEIKSIANFLDGIRLEVIATAEAARERDKIIDLLAELENYLVNASQEELSAEKIQINLRPILEDFNASYEQLENRLKQLDRPTFERMLELRGDMDAIAVSAIANELELTCTLVLEDSKNNLSQAQVVAERQWLKVQSYLRDTGKEELHPEAIKRELQLLLEEPQVGGNALKARLGRFDRHTLVQLLSERNDLTEEQVESTLDSIEGVWLRVKTAPQRLATQTQRQYEEAQNAIANYLRSTGKNELNPEGIKQDLTLLLNNRQLGIKAIRQRLAAMDRDTLVQLLAQRDDLNQAQVNQIIDEVQFNLRSLAKVPRRLAIRTQAKVQDFQSSIADYLRSTDKEALNPEGIKKDFQLLLNDPRAGAENLQDRLSKFDRDTLVQLLSQREDISQEDVNQIIDEILAVRARFLAQLEMVQDKIESIIDQILTRVRNYLNSLERPELNYYGIKQDLQTLFDDPQAGFEALRDRFSQLDRDTLIAVLSSREDISQTDAERLVTQVERTRDRILQRAESIQNQANMRLEQTKIQAQRQLEETRQAAATASWWLFFTALISAVASASAGALGVGG